MGEGKTDVGGVEVGLRAAFSNFTSTSLQRLWSPLELGPVFCAFRLFLWLFILKEVRVFISGVH